MSFSDYTCFKILDVYRISRKADTTSCRPRPWSALAFRLSGESVFQSNSKYLHADAGSILYIPAGIAFSRESTDEELIVLHLICYEEENAEIEVLHPCNFLSAHSCFCDIHQTWEEKKAGHKHQCMTILHTILAELSVSLDHALSSYKQLLIRPGADYIDSNFDNPSISIEQISQMCSISQEYFRKLYKSVYGISPHKAIMDKRIQKSCRLLQSGYFSIEEVAEQSGFLNCKYYSTLFHKTMKMSPREYKRIYNN